MLGIDKAIKKIITALSFIGITTKNYTIEDLLNIDLGDINAIYKSSRLNNTPIAQKSYTFLTNLFRSYGGKTLFDVLKNMYRKKAYAYDTNFKKSVLKKLKSEEMKIKNERKRNQVQNVKRYNNPAFIEYRTKTLAKAIEDTTKTNSIAVLKRQIYNINYLSLIDDDYALQNNLAILNRIIDFVEKTTPLLDPKYTEDIWHIKAELYQLKSMISHQNIYNSTEIMQEINEIITYTSEHL